MPVLIEYPGLNPTNESLSGRIKKRGKKREKEMVVHNKNLGGTWKFSYAKWAWPKRQIERGRPRLGVSRHATARHTTFPRLVLSRFSVFVWLASRWEHFRGVDCRRLDAPPPPLPPSAATSPPPFVLVQPPRWQSAEFYLTKFLICGTRFYFHVVSATIWFQFSIVRRLRLFQIFIFAWQGLL